MSSFEAGGVLSSENTPKGQTAPTNVYFLNINKQVGKMVIMSDLE